MAKGNLLLGTATGKVGDIVLQKGVKGETITRVRRRTIKNPNTAGQLLQRAITATIMQMYSAGAAILDHSFEGRSVPSGSMRRFQSVNMRLLREALVNDMMNKPADNVALAAVVARGATSPAAFSFIVSEGRLQQNVFSVVEEDGQVGVKIVQPNTNETFADYYSRLGLVAGDIYTVVGLGSLINNGYDQQSSARFEFARLIVRAVPEGSIATSTTFGDIFELDAASSVLFPTTQFLTKAIGLDQIVGSAVAGAIGVIRSREDSKYRSTCRLQFAADIAANKYAPTTGIKYNYIADAWNPEGVSLGNSDLILEGGSF